MGSIHGRWWAMVGAEEVYRLIQREAARFAGRLQAAAAASHNEAEHSRCAAMGSNEVEQAPGVGDLARSAGTEEAKHVALSNVWIDTAQGRARLPVTYRFPV